MASEQIHLLIQNSYLFIFVPGPSKRSLVECPRADLHRMVGLDIIFDLQDFPKGLTVEVARLIVALSIPT